jgi:ammonia channel protein AmtB
MNTLLASAIAGLFVVVLKPYILKTRSPSSKYDVSNLCNGILVGCVSITGACDRCENWAAIIIGVVSAFFYIGGCAFI